MRSSLARVRTFLTFSLGLLVAFGCGENDTVADRDTSSTLAAPDVVGSSGTEAAQPAATSVTEMERSEPTGPAPTAPQLLPEAMETAVDPSANGAVQESGQLQSSTDEQAGETERDDLSEVQFMPLATGQEVVSFVEIERYMGRWYEIATTPSFQQRSCYGTEAQYTFNADKGWVDVVNKCNAGSSDGQLQQIRGRAELVDTDTQAKLQVIFFGQGAPYWVVALDGTEDTEPYQWAVVSVPGGRTMWILSRTPTLTDEQREVIESHLLERGFPVDTLIDTPRDL